MNDLVLDNGLAYFRTNGTTLHACSAEPANFAGVAAVSLGSAPVTNAAIADRTGGGREVIATPASGEVYGTSGTATHYAIVNTAGSVLLVANALGASRAVNAGDPINIEPAIVALRDAVSV